MDPKACLWLGCCPVGPKSDLEGEAAGRNPLCPCQHSRSGALLRQGTPTSPCHRGRLPFTLPPEGPWSWGPVLPLAQTSVRLGLRAPA